MTDDVVKFLSITLIQPNPFQPRNKIKEDEISELISSVKRYGILEPLVIAETPAGYQIIAGERRWRAARAAGLTEVPALIKKTNPRGMLEMALIENVQRVDLNPIERGQAFQQLQRDFNLTTSQIADRVDKSLPYISNSMKLLSLPDAVKDGLVGGQITEGHARALSGIQDQKDLIEIYKQLLKENASVRRAEELVRLHKSKVASDTTKKSSNKVVTQVDDNKVKLWQEQIGALTTNKAKLKLTRSRTSTRITIIIKGSPEETQSDLESLMKLADLGKEKKES